MSTNTGEFDIIARYFSDIGIQSNDSIDVGIGDDAAVLQAANERLVVCTDTLVEGIHFPKQTAPEDIAYKALSVNLSDVAAMGAKPRWFTLAISMPLSENQWLAAFSKGLRDCANRYGVSLVGGDTTRNQSLTITIQLIGEAIDGKVITRQGALEGDDIFVSGYLGDAGLALQYWQRDESIPVELKRALDRPEPRLELGQRLLPYASAMIDCSDGLIADLGHITEASGVGAHVKLEALPLSPAVKQIVESTHAWHLPLSSGDDYELIFTASSTHRDDIMELISTQDINISRIGYIQASERIKLSYRDKPLPADFVRRSGYQHFSN